MKMYIICPLLLVLVGCATTKPEASIRLKDTDCKGIVMVQTADDVFVGCAEMLLRSNMAGIYVDAKIVDRGIELMPNQIWNASLVSCEQTPSFRKERASFLIEDTYSADQEQCLILCIQLKGDAINSLNNISSIPAVAFVTVCPPLDP